MFHNTYQAGFLSILYSIGSKPLQIWDSKVQNGYIQRITDEEIQSSVLEIVGTNVSTNYIHCPGDPKKTLGIRLPYLVLILKNLDKYFTFEVQVLDDKNIRRRFRASTFQSCTRVKPFICTMPMKLDEGWNQIQFNLADFTRRAYGTNYVETLRVQVHANCRLRRIYFSDRLYSEEELPASFKVFLPVRHQQPQHHSHHTHHQQQTQQHRAITVAAGKPHHGGAQPPKQEADEEEEAVAASTAAVGAGEEHEAEVEALIEAAAAAAAVAEAVDAVAAGMGAPAPPVVEEAGAMAALALDAPGVADGTTIVTAAAPDKEEGEEGFGEAAVGAS